MDERNHLFGNTIIREEKDDKHKMYNVSTKYIDVYTNKAVHSVDSKYTTKHAIITLQRNKQLKLFHKTYYIYPLR